MVLFLFFYLSFVLRFLLGRMFLGAFFIFLFGFDIYLWLPNKLRTTPFDFLFLFLFLFLVFFSRLHLRSGLGVQRGHGDILAIGISTYSILIIIS